MRKRGTLLWLAAILAITIIAYLPAFNCGFTNWDDPGYVSENPYIRNLDIESLKVIFSTSFMGNYHPLTILSFGLDYNLAALNPKFYHVTNILIHLMNTSLVFWLVLLLFKNSGNKHYLEIAIITSSLFGVHTLHVESVVWISERKDVLFSMFFLSSLIAYTFYAHNVDSTKTDKSNLKFYFFSIALFLIAVLSKVVAVSLAVTVIVIDYLMDRKIFSKKVILEKIPFLIIAIILGIIALKSQPISSDTDIGYTFAFPERILLAGYGLCQYIFKLCLPIMLSALYPYPETITYQYWLYSVVLLAIIILFIKSYKRHKPFTFGILFFIVNIVLLLQLIPVGSAVMADRYIYIPSIGFYLILSLGYGRLIDWFRLNKTLNSSLKILTRSLQFFLFAYIIFLTILTYNRCKIWDNSISLWNDVLSKHPNSELAWSNRGDAFYRSHRFQEAIRDFGEAIRLKPDTYYEAYLNRGIAKGHIGDNSGSIQDLDKAIQIKPNGIKAYFNRAITFGISGNKLNAIEDLTKVIQLDSNFAQAYYYRGLASIEIGSPKKGCPDLNMAKELGSHEASSLINKYCK